MEYAENPIKSRQKIYYMEKIDIIIRFLELLLSIAGIVIPLVVVIQAWRDKKRSKLAEQVIAYYYLQEEAINIIASLTSQAPKTIKTQIREKARDNVGNKMSIYPDMTPKEAEKYL